MGTNAKNHEHQWIFLGDLLMTYTAAELKHSEPDLRRLEYCGSCSTARLHMGGDTWAVIQGDCTKSFLEQFDTETGVEVKHPPAELTFKPARSKKPKRLGKGLADLLQEAKKQGTSLFPVKPEKKN